MLRLTVENVLKTYQRLDAYVGSSKREELRHITTSVHVERSKEECGSPLWAA